MCAKAIPLAVSMTCPNQPISLYSGTLHLSSCHAEETLEGKLQLIWLPTPKISFVGRKNEADTGSVHSEPFDSYRISVPGFLQATSCFVRRIRLYSQTCTEIHGFLTDTTDIGNPDLEADSLLFALSNFHQFIGSTIQPPGDVHCSWKGRREFKMGMWIVTIDETKELKERLDQLEADGGYLLTHSCRLRRADSRHFRPAEADQPLFALHYLFAFMRGFWTGPVLPTVVSEVESPRWQRLHAPILEPWKNSQSWYPLQKPVEFNDAATHFYQMCSDEDLRTPLVHTIWWYVEANVARASEPGLLMAYTALELLGWVIVVESRGLLSQDGFEKLPTADKIRTLLTASEIPLTIPTALEDLDTYGRKFTEDGPGVLARIRNAIVHPKLNKRRILESASPMVKHEARTLAIQYVELVLLRLLNYQGYFNDRTIRGVFHAEAEALVPWAT